jgi:hypothetical protein
MSIGMRPPPASTVRLVVIASVLVTAVHFTDNFVSIETYPQPGWITETVVAAAWPLFTMIGIAAAIFYGRGRTELGAWLLLAYSYTGVSSLGHFLSGGPEEFTTRGLVSVLADGMIGITVLSVAVWALLAQRHRGAPAEAVRGS